MMAVGWKRIGVVLGATTLVVAACSSDENGVLLSDGGIADVSAAGSAGSAGSEIDGSVAESGGGGAATDGATTDALLDVAAFDVNPEAGICNNLVNTAMVVTPTLGTGNPPALTGGTITPGTYVETMIQQFGGDGGVPLPEQSTIQLSAGTLTEVVKIGNIETRFFSTYTVMMMTINITTTCDSSFKFTGMFSAAYQASATQFIYEVDNNGGKLVKTYTKM
jgi:hypothetical protein